MSKANPRLEAARKAYREALEAARARPSSDAWARLLAAGRELSSAEESRPRSRRGRKPERIEPTAEPVVEAADEPGPAPVDHLEGLD